MPDPFRLLNPGDSLGPGDGPFNSQWHNAVTESVRATQRNTAPGVTAKSIDTDKGGERWYANISEANVDQFVAVGLGDLAIPPDINGEFRERVVFYTAELAADEPFGITQEPVGAGYFFIAKANTGPGGQPPSADWVRMLGDVAAYNGSTAYTVGMRVSQSGSDYVCIATTTGNSPPNASYWVLEGTHQGPWMLADSYVAGDVIVVPPMGRLKVSGDSPVWLDVTDAAHKRAGVVAGVLESTSDGPLLILWREGGTGEQWAVVRFDDAGGDCCTPQDIEVYEPTEWTTPCTVTVLVELTATGGMPTDAGSIGEDFISGGSGGGAYSASVLTLEPGTYSITEDADFVYFSDATPTVLVKAEKGTAGAIRLSSSGTGTAAGGAGGDAANGIGDVKYSGGDGGQGEIFAAFLAGGGGGGAGGRYADGQDGADGADGDSGSGQGGRSGGSVYWLWESLFPFDPFISTGCDAMVTGVSGYTPYFSFGGGGSSGNIGFETTAGGESRFQARITVQSALLESSPASVISPGIDGGTW